MLKSSPYSISDLIKTLFGASLSILVLLYLTQLSHQLWIMAPFGATCVLLYAAAQSPLAQKCDCGTSSVCCNRFGICALLTNQ